MKGLIILLFRTLFLAFLLFLVVATEGVSQTSLLLNKRFVTEANDTLYIQQLEQQVKAGMDINQIDLQTGWNAISMLIHLRARDLELPKSANRRIKLLLDNGADPNLVIASSRDFSKWEGYSPLQMAVHYEFKEIVQTLIDGWADVNAKTPFPDGRTPLHLAADKGNEEIVQALITGWADLDTKTLDGYTALHLAVDKESKEIVQTLIKAGADLDIKTLDGYTALHLAVDKESKEIAQILIKAGADLDIKTLDGYTAMHLAADNGNEEIVQALITGWADLDTKTLDGYTALHLAEDNGNEEIVQALIEAGVNKSIPSANLSIPNYLLALGSPTSRPKDFTVSEDLDIDSVISQILEETTPSQPVQAVPEPEPEALTTSEIERLRSLIVDNWNIGALSSEAKRVILTVRIRMDETGKPIEIELYDSDGGVNDKAVEVAFEVARKAITKGLENGHDLPKDKYDLWKEVLYTFNPEQMRKR